MGIDVRIETWRGDLLEELGDPKGLVNWLLSFAWHEQTACLRFIDPYGDTIFNVLQMPQLQAELEALRTELTESNLLSGKRDYLRQAENWPQGAVELAKKDVESITVEALREQLDRLLGLIGNAVKLGAQHYVRFVGD